MKKLISSALRVLVSVSLILILLYIMRDKYGVILKALAGANIFIFLLAFLAFILAICVASLRLKLIVETQENIPINLKEAVSLTFIGYFFNNFLPTSIGGDVVKAYHLSKKTKNKIEAFTAIFVDRAIGLFTMVLMAFVALFLVRNDIVDAQVRYIIYIITAVALMLVIFMTNREFARKFSLLFVFIRPLEDKFRRLYNAIHVYKDHTDLMIRSLAISVICQLLFFASIGILAMSLGARIPMMDVLLRMPIISAISLLPSINGLGVREGSTVLFFGPLIGKERAFVVSILWLIILLMTSIIGGIIYAVSKQFRVNLKEVVKEEGGI